MLDPISYSLAKKALKQTKPVIPSSEEIDLDNNFWFDLNTNNLKTYHFTRDKWAVIKKYVGYDGFDNNLENGVWINYINIPISTPPTESTQYKIEISGDNINIYSNDGTSILASGTGGLEFWSKVSPTGYDIRVFDETLSQNYFWIEKWDYANQEAIIWVAINAGQDQINIAYNNTDCLPSNYNNGDNVFLFFDDFNGTSLDTNKWSIYGSGGSISIANSILTISQSNIGTQYAIYSNTVYTLPTIITTYRRQGYYSVIGWEDPNDLPDYTGSIVWHTDPTTNEERIAVGNGTSWIYTTIGTVDNTNYHTDNIIITSSGASLTRDGSLINSISQTQAITSGCADVRIWGGSSDIDWIIVRNYLSTDLTFGTPIIKQF